MFICEGCGEVIGPRVPQVVTTEETQAVSYFNKDEDDKDVITHGTEIVRESKKCRPCAGLEPLTPRNEAKKTDAQVALGLSIQEHGRKCKKPLDDCWVCKKNIEIFSSFPLPVINKICEDHGKPHRT